MPIQFHCSNCAQPIEVDEPLAGKQAQCPYCRSVVVVPALSSLETGPGVARPIGAPAVPPPPIPQRAPIDAHQPTQWQQPPMQYPSGAPSRGQITAGKLGTLALIATALAIASFGAVMVPTMAVAFKAVGRSPTTMPSMKEQQRMQEELIRDYPWYAPTYGAAVIFGFAGFFLALTGLFYHRRGNWMIWLSLSIYAIGLCVICSGIAMMVASMGA